jgi:hypothetical protein
MASKTHDPGGIVMWLEDDAYISELHPNRLAINHEPIALLSIHHALITFFLAMFLRSYNIHHASSGSVKISEEGKSYISRPEPTYCEKT